jgi:hypothetical protein
MHVKILDKLNQKKKSKLTRLRAALDSSESGESGVSDGGKYLFIVIYCRCNYLTNENF